jgi:biotin carboxylase
VTRTGPVLLIDVDHYALRVCEERGLEAVLMYSAATRDRGLPELPACVTPIFIENHDVESVLAGLRRHGLHTIRPAGVYTFNEWAVTLAAVLATLFDCASTDPHTAIGLRDKSVQKELIRKAGIPTADVQVIEDIHNLPEDFSLPSGPGVVKPIAGGGSGRTFTVDGVADVGRASVRYRQQRTSSRTFVYESFVAGEEWLVDGFVVDGELAFASLATYNDPCLSALENSLSVVTRRFDPVEDREYFELAMPIVKAALSALNLTDAVFHMELFRDPDTGRLIFGECAARRGGGLIQEEVAYKFGIDLAEAGLACALGQDPRQQVRPRPGVVGSVLLAPQPGTLMDGPTPMEMMALPGVEFATMEMSIGTTSAPIRGDLGSIRGTAMIVANTVDEFDKRVNEVCRWYAENSKTLPHDLLKVEREQWQRQAWPDRNFDKPLYRNPST